MFGKKLTRFKIEPTVWGPDYTVYLVYRHLGWPAGWAWSSDFTARSRTEAEEWIEGVHRTEREAIEGKRPAPSY